MRVSPASMRAEVCVMCAPSHSLLSAAVCLLRSLLVSLLLSLCVWSDFPSTRSLYSNSTTGESGDTYVTPKEAAEGEGEDMAAEGPGKGAARSTQAVTEAVTAAQQNECASRDCRGCELADGPGMHWRWQLQA